MSVIGNRNELNSYDVSCKDSSSRVRELEITIKFLKDEQKRMLDNLHHEIASLQAKNRGTIITYYLGGRKGPRTSDRTLSPRHLYLNENSAEEPFSRRANDLNIIFSCIHTSTLLSLPHPETATIVLALKALVSQGSACR